MSRFPLLWDVQIWLCTASEIEDDAGHVLSGPRLQPGGALPVTEQLVGAYSTRAIPLSSLCGECMASQPENRNSLLSPSLPHEVTLVPSPCPCCNQGYTVRLLKSVGPLTYV